MNAAALVTVREIAAACGITPRAVQSRAAREAWPTTGASVRGRAGNRFALCDLPTDLQAAILSLAERNSAQAREHAAGAAAGLDLDALLIAFERATPAAQAAARERLAALQAVDSLRAEGWSATAAREVTAADMQARGEPCSLRSLIRWAKQTQDAPKAAWLPLLLPDSASGRAAAEIPAEAWSWYASYYLSREQPTHATAYRRLQRIAKKKGWELPSPDTFERRMKKVSPAVHVFKREGAQAWARTMSPMQRDRTCFEVGEAVNGDGVKFDRLWVQFPGRKPISTATAWFWQDVRSSKVLAWRLAETENTDVFRLATYDLTEICAPAHVYLDNTRVAANKIMTGGVSHRNRFRKKTANADSAPDPRGLLLGALGAQVHFTNPDKVRGNPGAKPIERFFGRGGIHDAVATHPRLAGRGRSPANPIQADELREVIAEELARLNAQKGRRGRNIARGNSYDDEWAAGVARCAPTQLSAVARRMFLRSFEVRKVNAHGEVELKAGRSPHGSNRYWSEESARLVGERVAVWFDPKDLSNDVYLYTVEGRYLCAAQRKQTYAFNDTEAARDHAKFKERQLKAVRLAAEAEAAMNELERRVLYAETAGAATATPPAGNAAAPVRLALGVVDPERMRRAKPAPTAPIDYAAALEEETRRKNPLFGL